MADPRTISRTPPGTSPGTPPRTVLRTDGDPGPAVGPGADDPARAMVAACRALYDAIDRLDGVAADRVGIPRSDLRALNALERGPLRPRDLAASLGLTTGSVTSLVDRLEARGLVGRAPDPDDGRGVLVVPTEAVFAVLGPLYRAVADRVAGLAAAYGPEEARAAARHLRDVADAYAASATRPAPPRSPAAPRSPSDAPSPAAAGGGPAGPPA